MIGRKFPLENAENAPRNPREMNIHYVFRAHVGGCCIWCLIKCGFVFVCYYFLLNCSKEIAIDCIMALNTTRASIAGQSTIKDIFIPLFSLQLFSFIDETTCSCFAVD